MTVLSCDPGLRVSGVALFEDGVLKHAAAIKNPVAKTVRGPGAWQQMGLAVLNHYVDSWKAPPVDELVIEGQKIYTRRGANSDDILQLTGVCGAIAALFDEARCYSYYPGDWKAQVPRDVFSARIYGKLTDAERAVIEACTKDAMRDVTHAVGIGWFHMKEER